MKILISRLSALGDCVCTLPVAVSLKKQYPESEITWVVDPRFAGVIECCSAIDTVVQCKPGFSLASLPKFDSPFDIALDMQGLSKSALVVSRAKAKLKLGYHWQREIAPFFTKAVIPDPSSLHIVDQYLDVARSAGATSETAEFGLAPSDTDKESVKSLLKSVGVEGPFIVLNAGAGWASKRWDPKHFGVLAEMLSAKGIQSVLIGGKAPADVEAANQVMSNSSVPIVSLLGKTNVRELVALVSLSNAHVGGDTGSTHIAAALGVPAIGLYSITKPSRSCPYGQIHRCHYSEVGLNEILPGDVFKTCWEAI